MTKTVRAPRRFLSGGLVHHELRASELTGESMAFCGATDGGMLRREIMLRAAFTDDQANCATCLCELARREQREK